MKILVTGGTGFAGSHLCERLVGQGHYVRSLVRKGSRPDFLKSIGVEIVYGDLSQPATLSPAVRECEALCKPLRIEPPLYRRRIDFFTKSRAFDISKAKRELGFEPKRDLRTGIRLTAAWYGKEGLL